jgi:hypothetical protein
MPRAEREKGHASPLVWDCLLPCVSRRAESGWLRTAHRSPLPATLPGWTAMRPPGSRAADLVPCRGKAARLSGFSPTPSAAIEVMKGQVPGPAPQADYAQYEQ